MTQLLAGLVGAFGGQSRSPVASTAVRVDTSTPAIAIAGSDKLAKKAAQNADKERIMAILTDPLYGSILALLIGIYAAENIPWSEDETRRRLLRGLALSGVALTALGRAGVGDLTTAGVAAGAGISGLMGDGGGGLAGSVSDFLTSPLVPFGPVLKMLGVGED